jgi:hypothetical protein
MEATMRYRLILLAWLLLPMLPAAAQEPMTILEQKEWSVRGVCVGLDQCGFCAATDVSQAGVALRVEPPRDVSVSLSDHPGVSAAVLEIGAESFALTPSESAEPGESGFDASHADGAKIIQALRHAPGLTLRLSGDPAAPSYRYSLEEFPKAYAAILKACPGS